MTEILMGAITALLFTAVAIGSFTAGVRLSDLTRQKQEAKPTDEQKKLAEGLSNMLNYANRHKGGGAN